MEMAKRSGLATATTLRRTTLGPLGERLEGLRGEEGAEAAWAALAARCEALRRRYPFPLSSNALATVCTDAASKEEALQDVAGARIVCLPRVAELCDAFLREKCERGSPRERALYKDMRTSAFLRRLVSKRPLVFMFASDRFLLRDGTDGANGTALFDAIGRAGEDAHVSLADYLSYEEMEISALLAVSTSTTFINNGGRSNCGEVGHPGSFQRRGVYLAQTGARFERPERMEARHMLVTDTQNVTAKGYGPASADPHSSLAKWCNLYGVSHFPTFADVAVMRKTKEESFVQVGDSSFLNMEVYSARMEIVVETFLLEADLRAASLGTMASCFVVGLGLGVWSVHSSQQALVVGAYARVLRRIPLPNIAELRFSYFRTSEWPLEAEHLNPANRGIKILFARDNPADRLTDPNLLLVAQYAADANAFPGNEYWLGKAHLAGSGDPAAAACSTIAEVANPTLHIEFDELT